MLRPASLRWVTTQSIAAMTCDTSTAPSAAATSQVDQAGVGGDADEVPGVVLLARGDLRVAPGDDAGHVGAVAEGVQVAKVGRLRLERQVRAVDHLAGLVQPLDRGDAGVDQRHADALAGQRLARGVLLAPHVRCLDHVVDLVHAGQRRVDQPRLLRLRGGCCRVVAACAGAPPASRRWRHRTRPAAADSTPADHLLPRTDRGVGLVLICCSPSRGHHGEGGGLGGPGTARAHRVLPSQLCVGVAYGATIGLRTGHVSGSESRFAVAAGRAVAVAHRGPGSPGRRQVGGWTGCLNCPRLGPM